MYRKYACIVIISMLLVGSLAGLYVPPARAADSEPGWDFEDHGYSHRLFTALTSDEIVWELQNQSAAFQAHGLSIPEHLAYPDGVFNQSVIDVVSQYRKSGRTAGSGFINFPETYPVADWYRMSAATVSSTINLTTIQGWIDLAITRKGLLNLFTHDVNETHTTYGITPEMLAQILDYLVTKQNAGQLLVMTMREAYNSFDGSKAVVVVSFDDGYATTYTTAWPMLKARGLKGTSYINAIGEDPDHIFLTWAEILEMAQPALLTNWSISISSNPSNLGITTPSGLQNVTGKLTVTAYPITGYHFLYWLFDEYQLTDNPVTLPAQPNETSHTLTAFFSKRLGLVLDTPPDKPSSPSPSNGTLGVSTSVTLSARVTDPDEDPMNVSFYQWGTQNFTIIALPDTQYYSASYPDIFDNQTKWIVNNVGSMNIVFVTHEGDIVDTWNLTTPWQNANRSMSKLNGYVPWGVLPGSHDLSYYGNSSLGENATYYNTYFGYARFNGESWYGGAYQTNNNTNSYQLFSEGKDDYLIFHLQYTPTDAVLAWANSTIANYPNRRVIVTTHSYLNLDGGRTIEGTQIWDKFVKPHADQIFLVLCGHMYGVRQKTDVVNGHTVYQLLADYQDYSSKQSGLLRILKFSPALDKIFVSAYSPYTNTYLTDSDNQFDLNYDMTYSPPAPPELIGTVENVPSGGVASVLWSGLNYSTSYQWYAVATDPDGISRQSDIWNFTTAPEAYTLTVTSSPIGGGSVTLNNTGPYYYGDKVQLTAVPNLGWSFSSWSGDISGSTNPSVITMTSNKSVTATFSQLEYTLDVTVSPPEGGSVNRNNTGPYHYGDWVRLTADANSGWAFTQWSGDASGTNSQVDIFIDGIKSIIANFTQKVNGPPTIDSYTPLDLEPQVDEGASLNFTHMSSDPDGDPLYYVWLLDNVMQSASQNWTYMPDYTAAGGHNVTLFITDSYGHSGTQEWSVTVLNANRAPIISYYSPANTTPEVNEGGSLAFEHVSSDPDGDPLYYVWLLDHIMQADTQNWTYIPGYTAAGIHNVTLLVTDSYGFMASQQWSVTVLNANRAPTIDYYTPVDTTPEVNEGSNLAFEHVSSDLDGDPVYYVWLLDNVMQSAGQNWTYIPGYTAAGIHNVTLLVSDSYGSIATQQWSVTVLNANRAPIISYYAPVDTTPEVNEGDSLAFEHVSFEPDGDPLYFVWLLDNVMQSAGQNWTYMPDFTAFGVHNITLLVTDSYGLIATQQWSVTVVNVNRAPSIDSYTPLDFEPQVDEGASLNFTHMSSDPDGDPLYYVWLLDNVMQASTQNWTYTPDFIAASVHNVTLVISDSYGSTATQQWSVTVLNVNRAPTIDYYTPVDTTPEVNEGSNLAFEHVSSDLDGDPLYYVWLLDNVMQSAGQNWTYMPDHYAAGVHNVTLLVTDSYGLLASQEWSVTVLNVNRAPSIDSFNPLTDPIILEGQQQEFNITCSDEDGDILTVQWYVDDVPILMGDSYVFVADFGSAGVYNVTVVVSDGLAQASRQWNLTILDVNRPPTIDYYTPVDTTPEVDEGGALQFEHVSSDPDGDILFYSWLLDDVEVATSQNWTYSPSFEAAGTHNVTLVVYDSGGLFDSQQWEVSVLNVNRAPVIDSFYPLTNPTITEEQSQEFNVTYSDPDGDLVSVQWYVNGTPVGNADTYDFVGNYSSMGVYNVTVVISDGLAQTAFEWSLAVQNVNRSPIIESFSPVDTSPEVNEGDSLNFTHTSSDPDADALSYSWLLDSVEMSTGQNWTYSPDFEAAGFHNVMLVVSDGSLTATQQWSVTVVNV
jgi:peptidoglycan/xylan/chitin deacetylase (PgdA/CDA1 family)